MSAVDNVQIKIEDKITQALDVYWSRRDYNKKDLLLKLVTNQPYKESIETLFMSQDKLFDYQTVQDLTKFFDLLLVKNTTFIKKYIYWLKQIGNLNTKLREIKDSINMGVRFPLHTGHIICSATDSTEDKVIENYGGRHWKRIVNFLLGTSIGNYKGEFSETKSYAVNDIVKRGNNWYKCVFAHPAGSWDDSHFKEPESFVGKRQGESYVTLVSDNIPDHTHLVKRYGNDGDYWMTENLGKTNLENSGKLGYTWEEKNVYPEIAPLGWTKDVDPAGKTGASRYVQPHLNIPPYKDVYIWECVDPRPKQAEDDWFELESAKLLANMGDVPMARSINTTKIIEKSSETPSDFDTRRISSIDNLDGILSTEYESLYLLISDELQSSSEDRFESKNISLPDLASIQALRLFSGLLQLERRYLFKEVYHYLLSDIQDRIFLILKKIAAVRNRDQDTIKYRAVPGQYIFLYKEADKWLGEVDNQTSEVDNQTSEVDGQTSEVDGQTSEVDDQTYINNHYIIPQKCTIQPVTKTFIRGTSTLTEETKNEYTKYTNKTTIPDVVAKDLGKETVLLGPNHFPMHLHWSALLAPMKSISVVKDADKKNGSTGTLIYRNDPISGGIKYSHLSGTGNYKFKIESYGNGPTVGDNNMPEYGTLAVYQVVKS